jgi:hypothetical protein
MWVVPIIAADEDLPVSRILSFDERVEYQRRIEEVYWRHRMNLVAVTTPHVPFEKAVPESVIRARVEKTLKQSQALDAFWHRPVTSKQLQAEMNRIARDTRMPDRLHELFGALDHDPYVIAEVLARPVLAERLLRNWWTGSERFEDAAAQLTFDEWWTEVAQSFDVAAEVATEPSASEDYEKPPIADAECTPDSWQLLHPGFPGPAEAAVWTGSEMIVYDEFETWRYSPATDTWTQASQTGAPEIRNCTAVWTGTEMILWGGETLGENHRYDRTNLGGRYDPVADSWLPTSTGPDVPFARDDHVAVWTGTEMIVWGGDTTALNLVNTGGRYDPSSDTWTPTSVGANVPAARAFHTAVWSGAEMIIWGGEIANGSEYQLVNTGGRYSPSSDSWSPTSLGPDVPSSRGQHFAVWTGDEMIVWAGYYLDVNPVDLNTGGRYDPTTNSWVSTSTGADVPPGGTDLGVVWSGTEMLAWGEPANQGRYDPATDNWTPMSAGPDAPSRHGPTIWTGDEMIVWFNPEDQGRYDPAADTWTPIDTGTDLPSSRHAHTAVWTGAEMIVWGGCCSTNTGDRYDPVTNSWLPTSTGTGVPSARHLHGAVWTGTEMIVWGGWDYTTQQVHDTGGRYDPVADMWGPTSTIGAPPASLDLTAVWTGTAMIVWGGQLADGSKTDTGGRYDPVADTWGPTSTGPGVPVGRRNHVAVWSGDRMIVWGGDSGSEFLNTGGRYDPTGDTWSPTSTGTGVPTPRIWFTGVWSGSEMIVWSGWDHSGPATDTGGRYDPQSDTWTPTSTGPEVPLGRQEHAAVWTGEEMIIWGGDHLSRHPREGSRYDPSTSSWESTAVDNETPGGKDRPTAVWTGPTDQRVIVWGGHYSTDASRGGLYCAAACFAPGPSAALGFLADRVTISWLPQPGAVAYDVVKGDLVALRSGAGDFAGSVSTCLMNDGTETQVEDTGTPPAGQGFYYVLRSIGCEALAGTYDSGGIGQQGGRDAGISGSPDACP